MEGNWQITHYRRHFFFCLLAIGVAAASGSADVGPIERRIHYIRNGKADEFIRFSSAAPAMDVPYGENGKVAGTARFVAHEEFLGRDRTQSIGFMGGDVI